MINCGIYMIENILNNKKYIGQSINISQRWKRHIYELNNNTHHNIKLQNSWNKYGSDSFSFNILEECDPELLDEKEQFYISLYDTHNNGYNLDIGGQGCKGYSHTAEEILKMRMIQNPKSVIQLDKSLNIVNVWISASQASKELCMSRRGIVNCCERNNHQKTINGYYWIYKDDYDNDCVDWDYYLNINESIPKKILQFDLDMNFINYFDSICCASKCLSISTGEISEVCNKNRKSSHGFIFRFEDCYTEDDYLFDCANKIKRHNTDKRSVIQKDIDYNIIKKFSSLTEASKETGFPSCGIQACCSKRQKTSHGYIWEYA